MQPGSVQDIMYAPFRISKFGPGTNNSAVNPKPKVNKNEISLRTFDAVCCI